MIVPLHGFQQPAPCGPRRRVTVARVRELCPALAASTDAEIMVFVDSLYGLAQVHVDHIKRGPPVLEVHRGR